MNINRLHESVRVIMQTSVVTVPPEESVVSVAETMAVKHVHGIPVTDEQGQVLGIVTEGDFFVAERQGLLHIASFMKIMQKAVVMKTLSTVDDDAVRGMLDIRAKDIMTRPCVTVDAEITLDEVLALCAERHLRTLPIVNSKGLLIGIVSVVDVMAYLYQDGDSG